MTRALTPLPLEPVEPGASGPIDRYLGSRRHARRLRYAASAAFAGVTVELLDVSDRPALAADDALLWHVLWVRDEAAATVTVGEETWPIAPGDTVPVPAGMDLTTTGGQLGLAIRGRGATAPIAAPSHGTERFFGYNRHTRAARLGDLRLSRWKLTQPLALAEHHAGPTLVMALARSVVMRAAGTIDQLRQGEMALVDPAAGPIVSPDGLAYLLTIDRVPPD